MRGWGRRGWGILKGPPPEPLSCGLGDVQFSVASDDNSEFWLSPNESPAGAQLVAFVGKVSPFHSPYPSSALPLTIHPSHLPSLGVLRPRSPAPSSS